nr:GGDEF domain-containing protein [Halorhodospira abdelmalekii]
MAIYRPQEPIAADASLSELSQRLSQLNGLRSIAVTQDDNTPIGIVHRDDLLAIFSNPYAHSLYGRRKVEAFVRKDALIVSEETPLETLSRQLTDCSSCSRQDFLVVDAAGHYRGMASIVDLLREMTAMQVKNARQANPLSGLPGNLLINETLAKSLAQERPFVAVYCDLDNFKPYNDHYGHARGDEVIVALADILRREIEGPEDFIGHVGGDDFMLALFDLDRWRGMCERTLTTFEQLAPTFYDEADRQAGGISGVDRQGNHSFFPLVSITMAALPISPGCHRSPHELSSILSEIKHKAKLQPGNTLFVDRRSYTVPGTDLQSVPNAGPHNYSGGSKGHAEDVSGVKESGAACLLPERGR